MFGFASNDSEMERLEMLANQENGSLQSINHLHYCETNIPTNYYDYFTKWKKSGIEYPIDHIIEEESGNVKTLTRIYDDINNQINIFNNYKYDNNNLLESINYEKNIIQNIKTLIKNYNSIKEIRLNVYEYNHQNELSENIIKEKRNILIYDKYYKDIENYFDNYLDILNIDQSKRRK